MAGRESIERVLNLDTPVLEGVDPEAQEVLLGFVAKVVSKMPEEMGLKLFDDLRSIAAACYRCEIENRPTKLH